jgi:hypothetical protein
MTDKELGLFKEIPGGLRRRLPLDQEWKKAKETLYYEWYRCLNASKDYLECCVVKGKSHELANTYELFGDVNVSWPEWWQKTGRKLFSERQQYPKVRNIAQDEALNKLNIDENNFLILDIPLSLRRVTILEQINDYLDKHHPGKELDVRAQSSAIVQLETNRLQHKTVPILVNVAELLYRYPDMNLYQIAQKAKLAEHHLGRSVSESLSQREERQRREMAASRYKEQAIRLIHNAERLKFPSID